MNILSGIFIVLHGMVHFWYVTLSQGWVEFEADMGWTGQSWLFSGLLNSGVTRTIATITYSAAALLLVVGGVGLMAKADWARPLLLVSAAASGVIIAAFWDGSLKMIVQKGGLGLLINLGIIGALTIFR